MSEGHASTSGESLREEDVKSARIRRFCVNEIPWKLVPQEFGEDLEYDFLDDNDRRVTDVESFVWKWSPCGRYGIDLPGGRDVINQNLKDRMAVFDLHRNSWTFYTIDTAIFEIPRLCFLYWARSDIIVTVSLVKDYEPGPDDEVTMKFKQSFYYISHEKKALEHTASCKYRTDKTIVASYWYHIFENRHGEPFVDHNNDLWLVFSNGKNALILLPYLPTSTIYEAKCVAFDMNQIVSNLVGVRVFLDPFISSHFVPFVYRNEINFFIRIDSFSFVEEHNRDYGRDLEEDEEMATMKDKRGIFHVRINLKDVIEKGEKAAAMAILNANSCQIETKFTIKDVEFWRKIGEDDRHVHECFTQHGKTVVLQKWDHFTIDMGLSKKLSTRVADLDARIECCSNVNREFSYCSIDLDNDDINQFDSLILGTDVVQPHPTGSMFMFKYKENYGMTYCELPYFPPLSLQLKCFQSVTKCVEIDPAYYSTKCSLKQINEMKESVMTSVQW
uniref:Uncharacterized protein n=1 Tax=Caenorhabditis japonica TaxID=281687 RepID=A0A8R1I072_CAEJA